MDEGIVRELCKENGGCVGVRRGSVSKEGKDLAKKGD